MISPELQETAIRDHCRRKNYDLVEIITDLDLSGRFWKRRQVDRAITMIESGQVEVVVVWKISRVARNRLDWNIALDRVESVGGRMESATEPIDTSTSSGRFSRGILAELAAFESERAGEQWSETLRRRWTRGLTHSGKPRFGYQYTREGGFVPVPEEIEIVREMYRRYIQGQGRIKISEWLDTLDLPHAPSTPSGVGSYLRTGFAAGYIKHHDPACTGPHTAARCPRIIQERGAHEPLISEEMYDEFLLEAERRRVTAPRLISPTSSLAGLVVCASCGKRMTHSAGGGVPLFRCNNRECAGRVSVLEHRAETALLEWLPGVAAYIDAEAARHLVAVKESRAEREALERKATRAETALTKLTIDYARGMVPDTAYSAARAALEAERDAAALNARQLLDGATGGQERVALELLSAWGVLPAASRNRVARQLCTIRVTKAPGRSQLAVLGLWETQPAP